MDGGSSNDDVLTRLFTQGNFPHILRAIFDHLEPYDLLQCSLVCKHWCEMVNIYGWHLPNGKLRIKENLLNAKPKLKQLRRVNSNVMTL